MSFHADRTAAFFLMIAGFGALASACGFGTLGIALIVPGLAGGLYFHLRSMVMGTPTQDDRVALSCMLVFAATLILSFLIAD